MHIANNRLTSSPEAAPIHIIHEWQTLLLNGFHVIVITWARGIYGIYCTEAQGREVARGLSAINAMHRVLITILYPVGTLGTLP